MRGAETLGEGGGGGQAVPPDLATGPTVHGGRRAEQGPTGHMVFIAWSTYPLVILR